MLEPQTRDVENPRFGVKSQLNLAKTLPELATNLPFKQHDVIPLPRAI
jgi:hypothetical protein